MNGKEIRKEKTERMDKKDEEQMRQLMMDNLKNFYTYTQNKKSIINE